MNLIDTHPYFVMAMYMIAGIIALPIMMILAGKLGEYLLKDDCIVIVGVKL